MAEVHRPNAAHQFVYRGRKTACRSKPVKGAITIKKPAALDLGSINPKKRKLELNCDDDSNKKRAVYSRDVLPGSSFVDDYESLGAISTGSFGIVYKVREIKTGEIMAMKEEFNGLSKTSLTEIKILRHLGRHPSVVEFMKTAVDEYDGVFVLMEHVETDLQRYISSKKEGFCEIEVKALMKKLLEGVKFLHEKGVMHRDLKPPNVLVNDDGGNLKICDFGVSTMFEKDLPQRYPPCVGTLWYRAPELLRGIETYSSAVDLWAVGCMMAELFLKEALFQGLDEKDQLDKISTILGPADEAAAVVKGDVRLRDKFASAEALLSEEGFDLLYGLLRYDPNERITAECALSHAWFDEELLSSS